jgi:hypothetical protein
VGAGGRGVAEALGEDVALGDRLIGFHLEDAALVAVLRLDLHVDPGTASLEADADAAVGAHAHVEVAVEGLAVLRHLLLEDRGRLAIGAVLLAGRAGEAVVADGEGVEVDLELGVGAAHLEGLPGGLVGGDGGALVAGEGPVAEVGGERVAVLGGERGRRDEGQRRGDREHKDHPTPSVRAGRLDRDCWVMATSSPAARDTTDRTEPTGGYRRGGLDHRTRKERRLQGFVSGGFERVDRYPSVESANRSFQERERLARTAQATLAASAPQITTMAISMTISAVSAITAPPHTRPAPPRRGPSGPATAAHR